jgi:hypothetical protein
MIDKETRIKTVYILTQVELPVEYKGKIDELKAKLNISKRGLVLHALDEMYNKYITSNSED